MIRNAERMNSDNSFVFFVLLVVSYVGMPRPLRPLKSSIKRSAQRTLAETNASVASKTSADVVKMDLKNDKLGVAVVAAPAAVPVAAGAGAVVAAPAPLAAVKVDESSVAVSGTATSPWTIKFIQQLDPIVRIFSWASFVHIPIATQKQMLVATLRELHWMKDQFGTKTHLLVERDNVDKILVTCFGKFIETAINQGKIVLDTIYATPSISHGGDYKQAFFGGEKAAKQRSERAALEQQVVKWTTPSRERQRVITDHYRHIFDALKRVQHDFDAMYTALATAGIPMTF